MELLLVDLMGFRFLLRSRKGRMMPESRSIGRRSPEADLKDAAQVCKGFFWQLPRGSGS